MANAVVVIEAHKLKAVRGPPVGWVGCWFGMHRPVALALTGSDGRGGSRSVLKATSCSISHEYVLRLIYAAKVRCLCSTGSRPAASGPMLCSRWITLRSSRRFGLGSRTRSYTTTPTR